jgi:hypothetical protein
VPRIPATFLVLALAGTAACEKPAPPDTHVPGECTDETKICGDGTPVGRVGPDCDFAACPGPKDGAAPPVGDDQQEDGQSSPPVPTENGEGG